jgi:hypothetical protein
MLSSIADGAGNWELVALSGLVLTMIVFFALHRTRKTSKGRSDPASGVPPED